MILHLRGTGNGAARPRSSSDNGRNKSTATTDYLHAPATRNTRRAHGIFAHGFFCTTELQVYFAQVHIGAPPPLPLTREDVG